MQQHRGETHAPKWRPETIACQICDADHDDDDGEREREKEREREREMEGERERERERTTAATLVLVAKTSWICSRVVRGTLPI